MNRIKVLSVFGTRPEIIKMAPVMQELARRADVFQSTVVATGQHREMCKPYLDLFAIAPNHDLAIMEQNQTLDGIVAKILKTLPPFIAEVKPDVVLVQGDTSSAFAAALAAFHAKIPVGHVEAGLRTHSKSNPFPEEANRQLIGVLADYHFAPTAVARDNLLREGIPAENIHVTGNTVIDALKQLVVSDYHFEDSALCNIDFTRRRVICVTTHRRESFGAPLLNTLHALRQIVERFPDVEIVLPVHYNPQVRTQVYERLAGTSRIHLIEPLPYREFVQLLNKSYFVLTDSGGVQEEAPSLGKPVLVLRDTTERPEGVTAGTARLVGTDPDRIVAAVAELLETKGTYERMAQAVNPYGDGYAASRIVKILERSFAAAEVM